MAQPNSQHVTKPLKTSGNELQAIIFYDFPKGIMTLYNVFSHESFHVNAFHVQEGFKFDQFGEVVDQDQWEPSTTDGERHGSYIVH